jgi:predicted dehydrogenase
MLTIAYIGSGKSVHRYHLPFVLQRKNFFVKTIYSPHAKSTKWDKIDSINYTEVESDVFDDNDINLVVVCTNVESHFEYALKALNHNKHVLVEKPFTVTLEESKILFDLAQAKNLHLECYQNRRYDSDFLTVQSIIESGVLGDLLELEMHFDYYRPEIPNKVQSLPFHNGYFYGHACHSLDQVISYFSEPDRINYDVRSLLGPNRMNDYFDIDLFYKNFKVSIKSSFFRLIERPSFVLYGKKGVFVKKYKDRQEEHLKKFYMPHHPDFGLDEEIHYGVLTYIDDNSVVHEVKIPSEKGDYGRVYDAIYNHLVYGDEVRVKPWQTLLVMKILEEGRQQCI